jgi:RNA recognition motif-containing protein
MELSSPKTFPELRREFQKFGENMKSVKMNNYRLSMARAIEIAGIPPECSEFGRLGGIP